MLTMMWMLYGAGDAEAEAVQAEWSGFVDGMFAAA